MEVNTMEEGEINDVAGEEVVMEDMDYAKVKNKVIKPKTRVAGETGPELSSDEELRALFSTVGNRKKKRKSTNDSVKQNSNKNQNINKSQNNNQAKKRVEEEVIQQVESEAQNLGNKVTKKSGDRYDQISQNGKKDLGECFKSNKKGNK
jgi:predicted metal-dependent hydrolase